MVGKEIDRQESVLQVSAEVQALICGQVLANVQGQCGSVLYTTLASTASRPRTNGQKNHGGECTLS